MTSAALEALRSRLAAAWPSLRALFVVFHVLAVLLLSLPSPAALGSNIVWESENTRRDLTRWAEALRALGLEGDGASLEQRLRAGVERYAPVHTWVTAPFHAYGSATGAMQGWAMFASPQRHPAELHLDLLDDREWRPLYRPHSREHDFWGERLRHNRMRKQLGRFARGFDVASYNGLARFLAREAARAHPGGRAVRVRLYRYATLPPEAVRAGNTPAGRYEHPRVYPVARLLREEGP